MGRYGHGVFLGFLWKIGFLSGFIGISDWAFLVYFYCFVHYFVYFNINFGQASGFMKPHTYIFISPLYL